VETNPHELPMLDNPAGDEVETFRCQVRTVGSAGYKAPMNTVLLPGFMADAALWDATVPALRSLGPIQHGDLSQAATIDDMARQVLARAPDRFALVGFSMGGYVAREMARLAPQRVQALVLVATSARGDTPDQARRKLDSARSVNPQRFHGLSRAAIVSSLHPDRAHDERLIERIRAMGERLGGDVFVRHTMQARKSDLHRLRFIRCPTLIVAADQDRLRSLEEANELRDGIEGATPALIEHSGHMIPLEQPKALAEAVVPWLRDHACSMGD
jgi:pimeloyl-ACP methyl ester carboxylesterase